MRNCAAIAAALLANLGPVAAQELATPWQDSYNSRARLAIGNAGQPAAPRLIVGVEIRLGEGWKTYWRNPGDSGGIPPRFDWSASQNLASARVLYPAPERLKDALGDSIGYTRGVTFPIEITPKDASQAVKLTVAVEYGICREICVPSDVKLSFDLAPDMPLGLPPELAKTMARIPRNDASRRAADPALARASVGTAGPSLAIVFDVKGTDADLFLYGPAGVFLPVPKKVDGAPDGSARFVVKLDADAAKQLKGKTVGLTMVSPAGASETSWVLP